MRHWHDRERTQQSYGWALKGMSTTGPFRYLGNFHDRGQQPYSMEDQMSIHLTSIGAGDQDHSPVSHDGL